MTLESGKAFRQLNKYEVKLNSIVFVIQSKNVAAKGNWLSFHNKKRK